jgi:hypothetical protein
MSQLHQEQNECEYADDALEFYIKENLRLRHTGFESLATHHI